MTFLILSTLVIVLITAATTAITIRSQQYAYAQPTNDDDAPDPTFQWGNPKTPEREMEALTGYPDPIIEKLAMGGVCSFDFNVQGLEQETGTEFTDAMIDTLRNQTFKAINDTATLMNRNISPNEEPLVLGNPEDC